MPHSFSSVVWNSPPSAVNTSRDRSPRKSTRSFAPSPSKSISAADPPRSTGTRRAVHADGRASGTVNDGSLDTGSGRTGSGRSRIRDQVTVSPQPRTPSVVVSKSQNPASPFEFELCSLRPSSIASARANRDALRNERNGTLIEPTPPAPNSTVTFERTPIGVNTTMSLRPSPSASRNPNTAASFEARHADGGYGTSPRHGTESARGATTRDVGLGIGVAPTSCVVVGPSVVAVSDSADPLDNMPNSTMHVRPTEMDDQVDRRVGPRMNQASRSPWPGARPHLGVG